MPRYTTHEILCNRYPAVLKGPSQPIATSAFIDLAEGELDARIGARYFLPFNVASIHPFITMLATDLTYIHMSIRQEETDTLRERVDKLIDGLVSGTITLGAANPRASDNASWISEEYPSAFGYDSEVNWRRSVDQIEAAEDDRA